MSCSQDVFLFSDREESSRREQPSSVPPVSARLIPNMAGNGNPGLKGLGTRPLRFAGDGNRLFQVELPRVS